MPKTQGWCRHCHKFRLMRCRKLCTACHAKPEVRELYPKERRRTTQVEMDEDADLLGDDATAEEVERCIAEQMECLPSWWADAEKLQHQESTYSPRVVRLIKR